MNKVSSEFVVKRIDTKTEFTENFAPDLRVLSASVVGHTEVWRPQIPNPGKRVQFMSTEPSKVIYSIVGVSKYYDKKAVLKDI